MNTIGKTITLFFLILLNGCKDEELTLQRIPYFGNELRTDGYYYHYDDTSYDGIYTLCFFLFRNGTRLTAGSFKNTNLDTVEKQMLDRYKWLNHKSGWSIFVITDNIMEIEGWSTSVGGGLPVYKAYYYIENDTTLRLFKSINSDGMEFEKDAIYHFRHFSPKPDSTNNFIQ